MTSKIGIFQKVLLTMNSSVPLLFVYLELVYYLYYLIEGRIHESNFIKQL